MVKRKSVYNKVNSRKNNYKRKYNMTLSDYDYILLEQRGVCKVCGKTNKSNKRLNVDHDHTTGKIRGLLCTNCNTALGLLKDNKDIVLKLYEYVNTNSYISTNSEWKQWFINNLIIDV